MQPRSGSFPSSPFTPRVRPCASFHNHRRDAVSPLWGALRLWHRKTYAPQRAHTYWGRTSTAHRHAPCPTRWCRHRQHRQLEFDMVTDYNLDLLKIVQAQVRIVEPEGGRESAEQFGVRHGLAKRFSWWFVPAEPAMSRCGYDVEFLCLHCRWQNHVSVASGLGHELLGYDREKVVAAQPAASSCCIGNAQHRVVVPREQNADRAVDLGEGLTNRGWSNERWLRSSGTSWSAIDPTAEMSTSLCSLQTPRLRTNPRRATFVSRSAPK